jgi:hypothetical protein
MPLEGFSRGAPSLGSAHSRVARIDQDCALLMQDGQAAFAPLSEIGHVPGCRADGGEAITLVGARWGICGHR